MKASFKWMLLVLVALTSTVRVATAQSVEVDSIVNVTTSSFDVWGQYDFTPDSTGVTYFLVADNEGMVGATPSAYIVHNDTLGTWMASFAGLNPGTEYWVEPNGITQAFLFFTGIKIPVFTDTLFTMPTVTIDSLSGITTTSVTVNNSVTTGSDTLHQKVITSTNASFTAGLTWVDNQLPNGTTISPVTITGLIPNTNYWVKTEVSNRVGMVTSSVMTFTTLSAGVFSVPVSDSSDVTDTTVTMYGSANVAQKYWFIHGTDYFSIAVMHAGTVEGYTVWGGGPITGATASFSSAPSTTNYWCFVTEYAGNVTYGTTLSATTLPIDTPILSLSIPIVADTNATAIAFYSSIYSDTMFITYGQPTLGVGTQSTNPVYVSPGTGTITETLHNLIAGTNGEAQLHAIVHGVDVTSPIVSFVTSAPGVVIPFSGYITSVDVDPSLTFATFNFAFISENATASVWIDVANATDTNYIYPFPGGVPHYLSSTGGIAYDTIVVPYSYSTNHEYICRVNGWNIGNIDAGTGIYTSGSFHFDTYQDGTIGSFYSTPYVPIDYGDNATLHWTTSNAATVTISGIGIIANNGSISTGPLTETTTFTLTVNGLSGNVVSEEVTVEVNPTAVEIVGDLVDQMTLVFNDLFSVNLPQAKSVQVYNLSGIKIFESEINSNVSHFYLDKPDGIYICQTLDVHGNVSGTKKIILVH